MSSRPPMTAREILGLRRDFTPDQLKANFKSLALHLHPDKTSLPPREANALFQRLIAAYNELKDDQATGGGRQRRARGHGGGGEHGEHGGGGESQARQFHELRNRESPRAASEHVDEKLRATAAASLGGGGGSSSTNFDIQRFNSVFDRTRVRDASTDDGYGEWMKKVTTEEIAAQHAIRQGVQAYVEPEALVSCRGLQYTEIGQGKTADYGRGNSSVGQGHSLAFSDYRAAHSTDSRVIDPATARPRLQYGNMLEIETARAAPSEPLTQDEQRARAGLERQRADADARRQRTLRRQDVSGRHHQAAVTAALLSLGGS